jgi:hypothetical protein
LAAAAPALAPAPARSPFTHATRRSPCPPPRPPLPFPYSPTRHPPPPFPRPPPLFTLPRRLGWSTELGENHGPVGYSQHSYGYRDDGGARVHQSIRHKYGAPYGAGDVVGCLIDFDTPPEALAAAEAADGGASAGPADAARQARAQAAAAAGASREEIERLLYNSEPPRRPEGGEGGAGAGAGSSGSAAAAAAGGEGGGGGGGGGSARGNGKHTVSRRWWGSSIRFFVNGADQGAAFVHLTREARYYPAVSLFGGASVRLNPGPAFAFPPRGRFPQCPTAALAAGGGGGGGSGAALPGAPAAAAAAAPPPPPPASTFAAAAESGGEPPLCSPWRPLSLAEETEAGGGAGALVGAGWGARGGAAMRGAAGAALGALVGGGGGAGGGGGVGSAALAGAGLLRVGHSGGAAYNFSGTQFAYTGAGGGGKPEKKGRR